MHNGFPFVHINFACSLDGKIAKPDGSPYKFSSYEDLVRVHKLRSESDAILVGKNTIKNDDPKLTVNDKYYKSDNLPKAIILDSKLELGRNYRVFQFQREVIIFTTIENYDESDKNIKIISTGGSRITIEFILENLKNFGIKKLMVEGGKSVISSFLKSGLWNMLTIYFSPVLIGEKGVNFYEGEIMRLGSPKVEKFSDGFLLTLENFNY